ncbi:MAG: asparaginase [Pseudomonadota bacterium]
MSDSPDNPILVEVTRGPMVESQHRGSACVYDTEGQVVAEWGDVDTPIYPRSSIKLIQALPFIETGAADAWKVTAEELSLACASHNGEPAHVAIAEGWMKRMGLSEAHLACGVHEPKGATAARALAAAGKRATTLHNNCSGKHLGMIATALALREDVDEYWTADHPVQTRIRTLLGELSGYDMADAPRGVDGCSVPTYALPLRALASAMATIADPRQEPIFRQSAIRRLRVATALHPFMMAGTGRFDTAIMARLGRDLFIKGGAEGVYLVAASSIGLGVALKIDDGAERAAEVAIAGILRYLEVIDDDQWSALESYVAPTQVNHAGRMTGDVRIAPGWLGRA